METNLKIHSHLKSSVMILTSTLLLFSFELTKKNIIFHSFPQRVSRALLAQSVEHQTVNLVVVRSILTWSVIFVCVVFLIEAVFDKFLTQK